MAAINANSAALQAALTNQSLAAQYWRLERGYCLAFKVIFWVDVPICFALTLYGISKIGTQSTLNIIENTLALLLLLVVFLLAVALLPSTSRRALAAQLIAHEAAIGGDTRLTPPVTPQPQPLSEEEYIHAFIQCHPIGVRENLHRERYRNIFAIVVYAIVPTVMLLEGFLQVGGYLTVPAIFNFALLICLLITDVVQSPSKTNRRVLANRDGFYWREGSRRQGTIWKHIAWNQIHSITCVQKYSALSIGPSERYLVDAGEVIFSWTVRRDRRWVTFVYNPALRITPTQTIRHVETLLQHIVARSGKPLRDVTAYSQTIFPDTSEKRRWRVFLASIPLILYILLCVGGLLLRLH